MSGSPVTCGIFYYLHTSCHTAMSRHLMDLIIPHIHLSTVSTCPVRPSGVSQIWYNGPSEGSALMSEGFMNVLRTWQVWLVNKYQSGFTETIWRRFVWRWWFISLTRLVFAINVWYGGGFVLITLLSPDPVRGGLVSRLWREYYQINLLCNWVPGTWLALHTPKYLEQCQTKFTRRTFDRNSRKNNWRVEASVPAALAVMMIMTITIFIW